MTKTKPWNFVIFVLLFIAFSFVAGFVYGCSREKPAPSPQIVEVKRGTLTLSVSATGNLEMPHQAKLTFRNSGEVEKLNVEVGDELREGKVLAKLDTSSLERSVAQARANLRNARVNLSRAGPGMRSIELAQIQVEIAQISLDEALEQLEEATIEAPFNGIVGEVDAKEGDIVGANQVIVRLVDPSELEVKAFVDELDIFKVGLGQATEITFDALPDIKLPGEVKAASPLARKESGVVNYPVWINVEPSPNLQLKEGLTASAKIIIEERRDVLLVPTRAVMRRNGEHIVQVVVDDDLEERIVQIGKRSEGRIEIVAGLEEGEKVVVQPPPERRRMPGFFGG